MFLIFVLKGVYQEILSLGQYLLIHFLGSGEYIGKYMDHNDLISSRVASEYQEIHPLGAMNIDSVKINTTLIMMTE